MGLFRKNKKESAEELNKKGVEYLNSDGKKALTYFLEAAEMKEPKAMRNVAICYFKGIGVDCDIEQAAIWYKLAAEHGNISSMRDVAMFYYSGTGFPLDHDKARYWLQKAIDSGDDKAKQRMKELGL